MNRRLLAPVLLVVTRVIQGLAFGAEWGGAVLMTYEHAPLNRNVPGLRGYVVWEVTRKLMGDLETPDAFVSQWYDDEASMAVAEASPEMAEAWEDVPRYATMDGTWWVTKPHVYIPPPLTGPGTLTSNVWIAPPTGS